MSRWLTFVLKRIGCCTRLARRAAEAAAILETDASWPNLAIVDLALKDDQAERITQLIVDSRPQVPIVFCHDDAASMEKLAPFRRPIDVVLRKPFSRDEIEQAVARSQSMSGIER